MNFHDFVGNEEIKAALQAAMQKGRMPHAIILQGDGGLGKRTLARLIARAVVCTEQSEDSRPCGHCPACVRALAGSHPDIRVEEGSGASGNLSVDTIKAITEDAYRKPEEADCNIYLLFIKSKLSEPSQNKLLKVIEEPPGNALFILTIASAEALLPTIRSRAQIFTLRPAEQRAAAEFLVRGGQADPQAARELARIHGGNIGRMLSGGAAAAEIAVQIAELLDGSDEDALLSAAFPAGKSRDLFSETLSYLGLVFRDACVFREGAEASVGIAPEISRKLSLSHRRKSLLPLPGICSEYAALAGRNINMNLLVTAFCAKIRSTVLK